MIGCMLQTYVQETHSFLEVYVCSIGLEIKQLVLAVTLKYLFLCDRECGIVLRPQVSAKHIMDN